ncbi:MAG: copper resistance protein CopC/CopD, partial [Chloroflexi bacterium]|nr:copper resistance protein CopC/CopD [Chloroflexota bacterium]
MGLRNAGCRIALALLLGLLMAAGWGAVSTAQTAAHADLVRSDPAANAALDRAPGEIRLWFSEELESGFSDATVLDPRGNRVDRGDTQIGPADRRSMVVTVSDLAAGPYTVSWRAMSAVDGHVTKGIVPFSIGIEQRGESDAPPSGIPEPATGFPPSAWAVLVRWANLLGLALLLGGYMVGKLVLAPTFAQGGPHSLAAVPEPVPPGEAAPSPPARRSWAGPTRGEGVASAPSPRRGAGSGTAVGGRGGRGAAEAASSPPAPAVDLANRGVASLQLVGWGLLAAGSMGFLLLQAAAAADVELPAVLGVPLTPVLGTRYGTVWIARAALVVLLLPVLLRETRGRGVRATGRQGDGAKSVPDAPSPTLPLVSSWWNPSPGDFVVSLASARLTRWWWAGLLLSAGIALTTSLVSHSAASADLSAIGVLADAVHLIGASVWIGGLAHLVVGLTAALAPLDRPARLARLAIAVPRFSTIATTSLVAVFVTGVLLGWFQLGEPGALVTTPYGTSLAVKVALAVALAFLGAYNLLVVRRKLSRYQKVFDGFGDTPNPARKGGARPGPSRDAGE